MLIWKCLSTFIHIYLYYNKFSKSLFLYPIINPKQINRQTWLLYVHMHVYLIWKQLYTVYIQSVGMYVCVHSSVGIQRRFVDMHTSYKTAQFYVRCRKTRAIVLRNCGGRYANRVLDPIYAYKKGPALGPRKRGGLAWGQWIKTGQRYRVLRKHGVGNASMAKKATKIQIEEAKSNDRIECRPTECAIEEALMI